MHTITLFRCRLTEKELQSGEVSSEDYLGYAILTPLIRGRTGRSCIIPWDGEVSLCERDLSPSFLMSEETVHLFGKPYTVCGMPFISQDSMVMVCAQASIWMVTRYLSHKKSHFGALKHLPYTITDASTKYLPWMGRALPSEGMTVYQMVNALANLGFSPALDIKPDSNAGWEPINWIVKYLDSGIPVILTMTSPPHAVVACGSLKSKEATGPPVSGATIVSMDKWASGLIVNDDGLGPYKILPRDECDYNNLLSGPAGDLIPPTSWTNWWNSFQNVSGLIVALPKEVSVQARHIDLMIKHTLHWGSKNWLIRYWSEDLKQHQDNEVLNSFLNVLYAIGGGRASSERLCTRSFLIRSMEFLKRIYGRYPPALYEYYTKQEYPLYIWVVELCLESDVEGIGPEHSEVYGELIFDSTENKLAPSVLFAHVAGSIIHRDPHDESFVKDSYIPGVQYYRRVDTQFT